jgi:hypothetical protein
VHRRGPRRLRSRPRLRIRERSQRTRRRSSFVAGPSTPHPCRP